MAKRPTADRRSSFKVVGNWSDMGRLSVASLSFTFRGLFDFISSRTTALRHCSSRRCASAALCARMAAFAAARLADSP